MTKVATTIFDHIQPKIFKSTLYVHKFVSVCKKNQAILSLRSKDIIDLKTYNLLAENI